MNEAEILLELLQSKDVNISNGNKSLMYDVFNRWQVYAPKRGRSSLQCLIATNDLKEAISVFLRN